MGQYYKPVILEDNKKSVKQFMYSHDYHYGLKLMEHSYIGNNFVQTFERLILNNPQRVVWAGDYAEPCKGRKTTIYSRCVDKLKIEPIPRVNQKESRYIVNHSKKQFVDKTKLTIADGWAIHPLPLLTCEGNGQGGGDYFSENGKEFIGVWARDLISVESKKPNGYTEITPNFKE